MVMNEKYFPKRARFVISNKLVDLATDVSINYDQSVLTIEVKEHEVANDSFIIKERMENLLEVLQVMDI